MNVSSRTLLPPLCRRVHVAWPCGTGLRISPPGKVDMQVFLPTTQLMYSGLLYQIKRLAEAWAVLRTVVISDRGTQCKCDDTSLIKMHNKLNPLLCHFCTPVSPYWVFWLQLRVERKPQQKVFCWFYSVQPVHVVSLFPCFCITIMHCNLVFAFSFLSWCLLSGSCSMFGGQAGLFNSAAASHEYTLETVSAAGLISRGKRTWVLACISLALSFLSLSLSFSLTHTHTRAHTQPFPRCPYGQELSTLSSPTPQWANLCFTVMCLFLFMLILPISQVCVSINSPAQIPITTLPQLKQD